MNFAISGQRKYLTILCLCKNVASITNKCSGFGKGSYNGEYSSSSKIERQHKYERPGIHRSLLWGTSALRFYLSKQDVYKYLWKTAGYKCWEHNNSVTRTSTNAVEKDKVIGNTEVMIQRNGESSAKSLTNNQGRATINSGFPDD